MTEDTTMRYLLDEVGISEEAARIRLQDEDLWVLDIGARFDDELTGEEGVRMWEEAATAARAAADAISNGPGTIEANPAITQLVWDANVRAQEALRRAREREATPESEKDRFGLSPREGERLLALTRRSDAINTAIAVVEDNPQPNPQVQAETLDKLRMLSEEANMEVKQTKKEYGFKDY